MSSKISCYIDCNVPVRVCNFRCDYCYIGQKEQFGKKFKLFPHSPEYIARCLSPDRFGGICLINLCGDGETLLHPSVVELSRLLLTQGHYVSIVTNGTVKKAMNQLLSFPTKLLEHLFIKFSFHYLELKKQEQANRFFDYIEKAKASGVSFTVELIAAPSNVPHVDEIMGVCMERLGALCHVNEVRDEREEDFPRVEGININEHRQVWGQFASPLFEYRQKTWGKDRKKHFCYAGQWAFSLLLQDGTLRQCYKGYLQNIFEDAEAPINFLAVGNHCPYSHCFNSHVWDCLIGAVPEISSPPYTELRNRVCTDGSEWLTQGYQDIYNTKISDRHTKYDEDRKIFSNAIMTLIHRDCKPDAASIPVFLKYFFKAGIKTAAIYGEDNIAEWILAHINPAVPYTDCDKANAIIVTDYTCFASIKQKLERKTALPVINILNLPVMSEVE